MHDRDTAATAPPSDAPGYRYRDFPDLFWDLQPDARVDTTHPSVLARILTNGSLGTISKLISFDDLARELERLPIPENSRAFWRAVIERRFASSPDVRRQALADADR